MDLQSALRLTLSSPQAGQAQLEPLLQSPDAAYGLAQIFLAPSADLPLRQAAGLALRRFIPTHWPASAHKADVRLQLLHGLADQTRKIRLACAACVSEIASIDFHNDEWPELIDALIALIDDGRPECVDGGVRVLAEFVKADLAEDQLLPMTERMLPQLYQIVCSPQRYAAPSRARALAVFRQSVFTLHMVKDTYATAVQKAVGDILPTWNEAVVGLLSSELGDGADLPVRIEAVRALETVLQSFPKSIGSHLPQIISSAIQQLPRLRGWIFDPSTAPPELSDEGSDISAEPSRLAALLLDLLARIAKKPVARPLYVGPQGALAAVLTEAVACASITAEDEERWEESPDEWIADDDDDFSTFYGVRAAAHDLVSGLVDLLPEQAIPSLWSAVEYAIGKGEAAKLRGAPDWWKQAEAALSLAASVADDLTGESVSAVFDVRKLLELAVLPHLMPDTPMFLQARAFVVSSRFASSLPPDTAKQCVQHALDTLERPEASVLVKLAAVKSFTSSLSTDVVQPYCLRAIASCGMLLSHASDNQQVLLIETIESAVRTSPSTLAAADASTVFAAVLDRWASNAQDPILTAAVSDLCSTYAASQEPAVLQCLLDTILPRLAQAIADVQRDRDSLVAIPAVAILDSVLMERPTPLGDGVFASFASSLFDALDLHDDEAMLQDGIGALTQVVRKDCAQLLSWSDGTRSGLERLLHLLARTLAPDQSEGGGLFVGDLILHLLRHAGNAILPVLPDLLNALVGRLATAQTATFAQSLILPFAYLIHGQRDTVLDLLEQANINGRSGIEVLAVNWADQLETFSGYWNTRISTVALADFLLSRRPSLEHLQVRGEIIMSEHRSNVIVTRSKAKQMPERWTSISFPAKILKTLAGELSTMRKEANAAEREAALSDDGDAEWEDGDDDEEDDGFDEKHEDLAFLAGITGVKDLLNDRPIERQEDDEDLKNDPFYQLDIGGYVSGALRQAIADAGARISALAETLTPSEREVLRRAVE